MSPSPRDTTDMMTPDRGEATADMVEQTKMLLRSTDDRLRLARAQLEQSRKLLERFADLESDLKKRVR